MSTPRAWQRMLSGRRLDLLNPSPLDIEITDIARGLAFVARWNGQTLGEHPYSVAAHSLLVEEIFTYKNPHIDKKWHRAALLHDAAEYVLGDMISPVKSAIGQDFSALETRVQTVIHTRFDIPGILPTMIKREIKLADLAAAYLEARDLAGFNEAELRLYFDEPTETKIKNLAPTSLAPNIVVDSFLERFDQLFQS